MASPLNIKPDTSTSPSDTGTPASIVADGQSPAHAFRPKSGQQPSLRPSTPVTHPTTHGQPSMSPAPVSQGPLTSVHTVPARPKPGRKTAVDEPTSKRKAQNRQAQRAFRQRKQEQAVGLEESNRQLTATVEQLDGENKELRALLDQKSLECNAALEARSEVERRMAALEDQLRRVIERNDNLLNAQRMFQAQAREATTWRQQCHSLQSQLASFHQHQPATLPDGSVRLPPKNRTPTGPPTALRTPPAFGRTPPASAVQQPTPKVQGAVDGCGNCEETGDCPCVDTYIDAANTPKESGPPSNSTRNNSLMSIQSVLSPPQDERPRTGSHQTVPELSDTSSVTEAETDFTNFFKQAARSAPLPGLPAHGGQPAVSAAEKCGFCTDESNCLCNEAMVGIDGATAANINTSYGATALGPTPRTIQPGTCAACQANPEQKAYCESLAAEHTANRAANSEDTGRNAKRPRLDGPPGITIPCAEAYPLFQRLSRSGSSVTYDALYRELVQSQPGSRRGTQADWPDGKGRQYSAFEADIGEVLASLHRQGSRSSVSGLGDAGGGAVASTSDHPFPTPSDAMLAVNPLIGPVAEQVQDPAGQAAAWFLGFNPQSTSARQQMQAWPGFRPSPPRKRRRGSSAPPMPWSCGVRDPTAESDGRFGPPAQAQPPDVFGPFGYHFDGYFAPHVKQERGGSNGSSGSGTRAMDGFNFQSDLVRKYSLSQPSTPLLPDRLGAVAPIGWQTDPRPGLSKR